MPLTPLQYPGNPTTPPSEILMSPAHGQVPYWPVPMLLILGDSLLGAASCRHCPHVLGTYCEPHRGREWRTEAQYRSRNLTEKARERLLSQGRRMAGPESSIPPYPQLRAPLARLTHRPLHRAQTGLWA